MKKREITPVAAQASASYRAVIEKANAILERSKAESRDLTEAEATEFDTLYAAATDLANVRSSVVGGQEVVGDTDAVEARSLRGDESCETYIRGRSRYADSPVARLGVGAYLRAMVSGPRNEHEVRALSEGSDSAGGYTVPDILSARLIDKLRARATVFRAGAQTVPLTSDRTTFARISGDPTPAWRAESAAIAESDPTFDSVVFQPKSLAFYFKVSRELLEDSVNVNSAIETVITNTMALELDRAALIGSGASNQPTGIKNISGVNSVSMGTNGAAITDYDEFLDALLLMREDNSSDPTAAIMAPRTEITLAKLKDSTGQPLMRPKAIDGLPFYGTTQIPTNDTQGTAVNASSVYLGDFTRLWIGVRTSLVVQVLRERFAETGQYGFVAHMRADVQAEHAGSFAKIIGIIP